MLKGAVHYYVFGLAGSACLASTALAQTTPVGDQRDGAIDGTAEIVVTAQKRSQTLSDVPISVTAQTGKQLIDKGITTVEGLTQITPGLSFVESGRGTPVLSLRGVGFFDVSTGARPTVSVYSDEAPLPFSVMGRAASFDLERVEVLKGPQGTLFGQSSTGGAINFISAKPTSTVSAGTVASFGRFDTFEAQGFLSGPLTDTLKARVAVNTVQSGDWQRSYTRDAGLGAQNLLQGRLLVDWTPTPTLHVLANVNGFIDKSEQQAPQFIGVRGAVTPITAPLDAYPRPPSTNTAADWTPDKDYHRDNRFYQAFVRGDLTLSNAFTLTSLTSFSRETIFTPNDNDGTSLIGFQADVRGSVQSFAQELRASGDLGRLHYIAGGNYSHDRTGEVDLITQIVTNGAYVNGQPLIDKAGTIVNQRFDTYAGFGDATLRATDWLRLTAGIRYTKQELSYDGCSTVNSQNAATGYTIVINRLRGAFGLAPIATVPVGACVTLDQSLSPARAQGKQVEDNISWRAGVDLKPTPNTLIYFNINKGYKSGSAPSPAAVQATQFQPTRQESVMAYEAGLKSSFFDRHADIAAAVFYYDYTNKQLLGRASFQPSIFGPVTALVNVPKSRVIGAEAQLNVRPIRGMTLTAAATYLDTKVTGDFFNYSILGVLTNFNGSAFPYTPKWQLAAEGEQRFPVSSRLVGVVGIDATHRTRTIAGFGTDPRLNIKGYNLVDLRAGIETANGRWRVQVYGRNVFNEYYWTNVAVAADSVSKYTGRPATYGIQLGFRY